MKNLNVLNEAQRLNKNEMGHVTGGATYQCGCHDGSARWQGNYADDDRAKARAAHWCGAGGGYCA